jgi:hypothetical protein
MNCLSCEIKRTYSKPPLCVIELGLYKRELLSPRVLYYGIEEFFWECLACTAREGSTTIRPYQPSKYSHARYKCADVKNRLIIQHGESPSPPIAPSSDWHIIVVEYTRCYLTKPTDKLATLAGLASIFQANTGFTYLAGLWKEDICDGYTIMHNNSNPMSGLLGASITVQAEFKNLSYSSYANGTYVYDGKIRGNVFLDSVKDYILTRKPCTMLWIADRELSTPGYERNDTNPGRVFQAFVWSYFLVIVLDAKGVNSWRRIGLGKVSRRGGLFNGSERAEFKLV